jgi:alkaline phosphatase D
VDTSGKSRREFLSAAARAAGSVAIAPALRGVQGAALIRQDASRPVIAYGTASGDVARGRAIVWSRADRPARMQVEWSTTESFQNPNRARSTMAGRSTDFTSRVELDGLPPGQRIFYRVQFEDLTDSRNISLPATGSFLSAPAQPRDLTFAWSADTVGQGWGINVAWGGLRMYETMRSAQPDFFIHCGDTIYADGPVQSEVTLPDGSTWINVVTPAKAKVAETLAEYRGNYLYNLLDDNMRRFNAEIPQFVLWDDHEVRNNWYPSNSRSRALASQARRAFLEYNPIRAFDGPRSLIYRSCPYGPALEVFALDLRMYRGANSENRQTEPSDATALAGREQMAWLKRALRVSMSTWKVIASDLPIGLIVPDGPTAFEAVANGDGPPLGREHEVADLLRFIRQRRIRNVVWVTGDVHYAAAHHYHPERAQFKDFTEFWEFVAGPLHAGTFGPNALDNTFGPKVRFSSVPAGMKPNQPPTAGLQFFGFVRIAARTNVMTVELRNLAGEKIYSVELEPK